MNLTNKARIRVIAMDLDGTLTQHKEPLTKEARAALDRLRARYTLLMVGAGQTARIFRQLGSYPIDVIGNYGMQYARYHAATGELDTVRDIALPIDRADIEEKVAYLRKTYGYTVFAGESVEYHPSGCVTIPLLGTAAKQADKLAFDPDRAKRRKIYREVCDLFSSYHVFVGGSSSFDMAPRPYHKYYALSQYAAEQGLAHDEILYIGDDYGMGGNDESVYLSDIPYLTIDDYRDFPRLVAPLTE